MAAIANLVVYDNSAVAHTFVPVSITREGNKQVAHYRENSGGVTLEAQSTITLTHETLKSGVQKVTAEVAVPVMESISNQNAAGYTAAPKVAFILRTVTHAYWHPRSTEANRTFQRQLIANLIQGTTASVTGITTGQIPDLFDRVLMPT